MTRTIEAGMSALEFRKTGAEMSVERDAGFPPVTGGEVSHMAKTQIPQLGMQTQAMPPLDFRIYEAGPQMSVRP